MKSPFLPFVLLSAVILSAYVALAQSSINLTVSAEGTQPFTYKWTKDGAPLSATTNPLVLPVAAASSGNYQVTVLNAAGSATSAPNAVVVTASASQPLDLSKQYLEGGLVGSYTPPVNQWQQGFAVVPIKKVSDPGNHFNDATGIYSVGVGEAGIYEVQISLRAVDQPPADVSVGITAGTTNADLKTGWGVTPRSTAYIHWGFDHTVTRSYKDGDQIRCNIFVAAPITIQNFDVIIRRLF
jgi:hypothetical protein